MWLYFWALSLGPFFSESMLLRSQGLQLSGVSSYWQHESFRRAVTGIVSRCPEHTMLGEKQRSASACGLWDRLPGCDCLLAV